jgi:3-deoxy-manno-octulosonate cytidylyltransferase (CMP-KDO synthetase)
LKLATGIIPARYGSTRFSGKPLALILGKPMIQMVYERSKRAKFLEQVIVATDDERIMTACAGLGIPARLTSPSIGSGTERVAEVARELGASLVVNIQGDEPVLDPAMIDALVEALQDESIIMASLMTRIKDPAAFNDRNRVKVVVDKDGFALYFSRAPIPHQSQEGFFQHIGMYGFKAEFLFRFCGLPPSGLEKAESLEQLRALENGYRIKMIETPYSTLSVDSPRDIIEVEKFLRKKRHG